jgi:sec-independent protein translocase protein TatB
MFDISPMEMLTIALVALVVFGPQRLPDIARRAGHYLREIRRAASDLTAGLEREVQGLQAPLQELKEDLTKPVSELRTSLDETTRSIQDPLRDVASELNKPVSPGGPGQIAGEPATNPEPEADEAPDAAQGGAGLDATPSSTAEDDAPTARWIGEEPLTGVSPADAWKGIDDPIPPGVLDTGDDAPIPIGQPAAPPAAQDGDTSAPAAPTADDPASVPDEETSAPEAEPSPSELEDREPAE